MGVSSAIFLVAAPSHAQPGGTHLQYAAPRACSDEAAFRSEVRARTSRDLDEPTAPSFRVGITPGEPVRGAIVIRGADGAETVRQVSGASCAEVVSALAVIAAVVLDGHFSGGAAAGPPAGMVAAPAAPVAPSAAAAGATEPSPPPSPPFADPRRIESDGALEFPSWSAGLHGSAVSGTGAGLRLGPRLFAEATFREDRAAPSVRLSFLWTPSTAEVTSAGKATLSFLAGRVDGCPFAIAADGPASLTPCATFEVGRIAGAGTDTLRPADEALLWLAPGALARLDLALTDFLDLEIEGGAEVPLYQYEFYFRGSTARFTVAEVVGTGGVGLAGRLP